MLWNKNTNEVLKLPQPKNILKIQKSTKLQPSGVEILTCESLITNSYPKEDIFTFSLRFSNDINLSWYVKVLKMFNIYQTWSLMLMIRLIELLVMLMTRFLAGVFFLLVLTK